MKYNIYKTKEELSEELALWMCNTIGEVLKEKESFSLVLSGGETPKQLYEKLASSKFKDKIDWKKMQIFWGDERAVPFKDKRNNAKMAFDLLIHHVDIPAGQVHIIRTDIEPNFSANEYSKILHSYFDHTTKSFDLVLLGMGDDGHTLSLFPHSPLIEEHENWVNSVYNLEQKMYRISMMPIIVNRASNIVFMVDGSKKSKVLQEVLEGKYIPSKLPAQIIKPVNGELYWFLDEAAAKDLQNI